MIMKLTKDQQKALAKLVNRDRETQAGFGGWTWKNYRDARRKVSLGPGCVMIEWAGMWVGIEPDGYTHT